MNYKTYCTPLERPFPVEVQRGQQVRQAVTISVKGGISALRWNKPLEVEIGKGEGEPQKLPAIGSAFAADQPYVVAVVRLDEGVRMLSNIETEKSKLLQVVMVGQPSLRTLLGAPQLEQLRQRITVSYHLQPLDLADTHAYLTTRA